MRFPPARTLVRSITQVAEAAISSFDVMKRGVFSQCINPIGSPGAFHGTSMPPPSIIGSSILSGVRESI
jgi:hypothetical protein